MLGFDKPKLVFLIIKEFRFRQQAIGNVDLIHQQVVGKFLKAPMQHLGNIWCNRFTNALPILDTLQKNTLYIFSLCRLENAIDTKRLKD